MDPCGLIINCDSGNDDDDDKVSVHG